jgi:ABC-2 type transport system ATP-binding protein
MKSVSLFGDRIHVATQRPESVSEQAARTISAAGLELQSIHPVEPSLEDVFVSVLDREEGSSHEGR